MKMTDDAMTEMVTTLRNKTQMARFTADEVVAVFRTMEDYGYSFGKTPDQVEPVKVAARRK